MKGSIIIMVSIFFLPILSLFGQNQSDPNKEIDMTEFMKKYQNDSTLVVLDVRTEEELSGSLGKLDRIVHIPIQQLEERINELSKYKGNEISVICRSGNRSNTATKILREKGFNVKNVLGGMIEYRKLEKKSTE